MKTDLVKTDKAYYTAKKTPQVITLNKTAYLAIEGKGDPSGAEFSSAIQALYPVAYAVKFMCKALDNDFVVPKLEGQWWFDEEKYGDVAMSEAPQKVPRSEWCYRLLIRLPGFVTKQQVQHAIKQTLEKENSLKTKDVHFFELNEGKVVQLLHTGPFDNEPETLMALHTFMFDNNYYKNGLHHEIYLSDFRKTAPEKLRTILREPVR